MDEVLEGLRVANMAAGGHSGIFKQSVSPTGQYNSPTGSGQYNSPTGSGQYRSPTGSGQYNSPTGSGQYGSPSASGQHSQPMFASTAGAEGVDVAVDEAARAGKQKKLIAGAVVALCVLLGFGGMLMFGGDDAPAERKPNLAQVAGAGEVTVEGEGGPGGAPTKIVEAKDPGADPSRGPPVRFRLMSNPSGARVYYRGRERGTTPFVLEVPATDEGSVTAELTFAMDGYVAETVITGGSGEVVLMQKLQKRPPTPTVRETRSYASSSRDNRDSRVEQAVASAPAAVVPASASAPASSAPAPDTASLVAAGLGNLSSTPRPAAAPTGDVILPFGEGMSPPQVIKEGKSIQYTREARAAKIEGTMIVKCVITVKGKLENCRVLKSLPHMESVVLESLRSRVYNPITFQGKPVAVDYTFNIRLVPPRR
jgi:serine/threonine-protein kinase